MRRFLLLSLFCASTALAGVPTGRGVERAFDALIRAGADRGSVVVAVGGGVVGDTAGFVAATLCFYALGQVLLRTPSDFHEGTLWRRELLDEPGGK